MIIREIRSKSILSASKIIPYVINPYVGCQHSCAYCYARYMKKFTGHKEPWGTFVDVKINAAELLRKEICKKRRRLSGSAASVTRISPWRGNISSLGSACRYWFAKIGRL